MKTSNDSILITRGVTLLVIAGVALFTAHQLQGAVGVGGAGSAAGHATASVPTFAPPSPPPSPSVQAPSPTANVNGMASGATSATANGPANIAGSATSTVNGATSAQSGAAGVAGSATSTANGSVNGSMANGNAQGRVTGDASAALNTSAVLNHLNQSSVNARQDVLGQMNTNIQASKQAIANLQRESNGFKDDVRRQADAAFADISAKEQDLKLGIEHARDATVDTWMDTRTALAKSYTSYAQAVSNAELTVQGSASASEQTRINNGSTAMRSNGRISSSLDESAMMPAITNSTADTRADLLASVNAKVAASDQALTDLRRSASNLRDEDRRRFDAAYADAQAKAEEVKNTAAQVRNSAGQDWMDARARLAAAYRAYVQAVANVEVSGSVNVTTN